MKQTFFHNLGLQVSGSEGLPKAPVLCPGGSKGCKSENMKKNGHNTSVKSSPQKYICKDCKLLTYIIFQSKLIVVLLHQRRV